jgi:hypothetical protein
MADFLHRARDGLEALRQADPEGRRIFGATEHRYRLHPPLAESAVQAFEKKHRIRLPADYRAFLTRLGNRGAGPHRGILKLEEMEWELVGRLVDPFPHRQAWNLPPEELDELAEADDEAVMERYWIPVDGAIHLCDEGDCPRDWLVVSGPEAGHVWHDDTANFGGWRPLTDRAGNHQSFAAWYLEWLASALAAG